MDQINQKLAIMCSKHEDKLAQFIQINQQDTNSQIFYCDICLMSDKTSKLSNFVLIKHIIDHSEYQLFEQWPPLEDVSLISSIQKCLNNQKKQPISDVILEFFSDLKEKIANKIDLVQKRVLKDYHVQMEEQIQVEVQQRLKEIQRIEEFSKILKEENIDQKQKEQNCQTYISNFHLHKSENTAMLSQLFEKCKVYKQLRDFYSTNKNNYSILTKIDELDFFNYSNCPKLHQQQNVLINDLQGLKLDILPDIQLIKSKYKELFSKHFQEKKLENNMIQIVSMKENNYGSYYSNIKLQSNLKYIFRFKIENNINENSMFTIGLIRDANKDENYSYKDFLSCQFYYKPGQHYGHLPYYGIDKLVVGDMKGKVQYDSFELRVCLDDQLLEILDYPDYSYKLSLEDKYKQNIKSYQDLRLGIFLQHKITVLLTYAGVHDYF